MTRSKPVRLLQLLQKEPPRSKPRQMQSTLPSGSASSALEMHEASEVRQYTNRRSSTSATC